MAVTSWPLLALLLLLLLAAVTIHTVASFALIQILKDLKLELIHPHGQKLMNQQERIINFIFMSAK